MKTNIYKKLILSTLTLVALIPSVAHASDKAVIRVNGMVCDFCARALEKVFRKEESVKDIAINLSDKNITVTFKEGQDMNDETLKTLITDSGYAVVDIKRESDHE